MAEIVVSEILARLPVRTSDAIRQWVEKSPDHPALVEKSGAWTYRELQAAVAETELWLRSLGVRPGDRVMIVLENCRAFIAIFFALTRMDAWPVLVNAHLSAREIDQIREHCGARRVIYTVEVSPHAREHAVRHDAVTVDSKDLGTVAVGSLNESVEPELLEASPSDRVAALIYTSEPRACRRVSCSPTGISCSSPAYPLKFGKFLRRTVCSEFSRCPTPWACPSCCSAR